MIYYAKERNGVGFGLKQKRRRESREKGLKYESQVPSGLIVANSPGNVGVATANRKSQGKSAVGRGGGE